jgi:hypothetical protein
LNGPGGTRQIAAIRSVNVSSYGNAWLIVYIIP